LVAVAIVSPSNRISSLTKQGSVTKGAKHLKTPLCKNVTGTLKSPNLQLNLDYSWKFISK
jgi:hypothetical protein